MKFLRWLGGIPARMWSGALRVADIRMWVLIGAGPILTLCAAVLVYIVVYGKWPAELSDKRLTIVGGTLFATQALLAVIFVKIAGISAEASGPLGTTLKLNAREDDAPPTQTVIVNPPQAGQPEVHE